MKIIRVACFALGASFFAASCTKEAAEPDVFDWAEGEIYFKTSLAEVVSSRGQDMTLDGLESFQVTCFNSADTDKDADGYLSPYFENATFIRKAGSQLATFVSSPAEGTRDWPANDGYIRFFAFSPSLTAMADGNHLTDAIGGKQYFNLLNSTAGDGSSVTVGYRLGSVRINPDISRQFDFVTAEAAGERRKDFAAGVELNFSHQLCQIELRAWGAPQDYDFEIAGVRIGNPVVEGDFVFADDSAPSSSRRWADTDQPVFDKVEYTFRPASMSGSETQTDAGDRIFKINSMEHNAPESAGSIMGLGGCAMVIPTYNTKWEALADPEIGNSPYKTDRMYFSILVRVADSASGSVLYPYPGNTLGMKVVSYAVDASGTIISRLYPGKTEGEYFSDPECKNPYTASDNIEIKDFGWAAVTVDADWIAGKRYIYTLDYSEGIGLHDPEDPEPGKLIMGEVPVKWGVSVGNWDYAKPDDNYTPDLDVPEL